jgi:aryl-alcohol dehydrogenase-like predicted oxidoreductase
LGVDRVELLQLHFPPPFGKVEKFLDAMIEAVKQGKVRAVGVSNFNEARLRHAHAYFARQDIPLASNQVRYSLLYRYPEDNGVLDACRELNVALIAYSPLEQGILTGKFRDGQTPVPFVRRFSNNLNRFDIMGDAKGTAPYWKRLLAKPRALQREKLEPFFKVLEEIAATHERTIGQVALNWLITKDHCIVPIPGAKNARQARENAGAVGWNLSEEEQTRIDRAEKATR